MATRVVIIDNYDSFTYNLVQELGELGAELEVFRNDAIDCDEIRRLAPDRLLISPGPGRPEDAGITVAAIRELAGELPIMGVCLGHQAIGAVYGARIVGAPTLMHGKTSEIFHNGEGLFKNLDSPMVATRYHSLVIDPESIPDCLEVTARTAEGVIMGVRHRELAVEGVQFHPESILTPGGYTLLGNFLAS